jgi:sterol desaturase/sphingolipid hydroxylase (fatty acid hydroxylase superfamily)
VDLTVLATPGYFATMGAEYVYLENRAAERGPTAADYERRDTVASLSMGLGSLVAPLVLPRLLRPLTPGRGRYGKALLVGVAGAAALTTIADLLGRLDDGDAAGVCGAGAATVDKVLRPVASRRARRRIARSARRIAGLSGVAAIVGGGVAVCSTWASRTTLSKMWDRRLVRDLGTGPLALAAAVLGWDFIYYWNHRLMHESRFMWAIHVVHHSSERYNLSTALRQPVAEALGTFVPYSSLALVGVRPVLIGSARSINLLYQYWIHTDVINRLGPAEGILNTPSAHRVHHGRNGRYIDRNHGSILIVWDRLFGTFEEEDEPVVYGLTRNIDTFNPARIASHEHIEMLRDVALARTWRDRISYVVRSPGWSDRRNAGRDQAASEIDVDVDAVELFETEPRVHTPSRLRIGL